MPFIIVAIQVALYIILGAKGWINPFEFFNLLLIISNIVIAIILSKDKSRLFMGSSIMIIIMSHAFIGQKIAPDSLDLQSLLYWPRSRRGFCIPRRLPFMSIDPVQESPQKFTGTLPNILADAFTMAFG